MCLMLCGLLFVAMAADGQAKNTLTWTGAASSDWNTAGNWNPQIVPGAADDVQIGMATFTNQPVISGTAQCGSITLGSRQPIVLTVAAAAALTVNGILMQQHSEDNLVPATTITGGGTLSCSAMVVGDGTASKVVLVKTTSMISTLATLNVTGDMVVNSVTADLLSGGLGHNNALFSLQGGVMTLGGQIRLLNLLPAYLSGTLTNSTPNARFSVDIASGLSPRLRLLKDTSLNISDTNWDAADYYNNAGGTGNAIVEFAGGNQVVNTGSTPGFDIIPQPYQNLIISGSGTKNTESSSGDALPVGGYLHVRQGTLDLQTNHASLMVNGDFSNAATTNLSKATFLGANFSNSGQISTGADTVRFLGNNQALLDTTANGTALNNVVLQFATKTISSGGFLVPAGGYWKVVDESTAMAVSPGAQLAFRSDGTGQSTMVFASVAGQQSTMMTARSNTLAPPLKMSAKAAKLAPVAPGAASLKSAVKASAPLAASRMLSAKAAAPKTTAAVKAPAATIAVNPTLTLKLSGNGEESTVIVWKEKANAKYMPSEDRYYLAAGKQGVSLASYSADGRKLAVNTVPLSKQTKIKLWVSAFKSGTYALSIAAADNLPAGCHTWLTDKVSGSRVDLTAAGNYSFAVNKKDQRSYGDRFEIGITLK